MEKKTRPVLSFASDEEAEAHRKRVGTKVTPEMMLASGAPRRKATRAQLEKALRDILAAVDYAEKNWNGNHNRIVNGLYHWRTVRELLG